MCTVRCAATMTLRPIIFTDLYICRNLFMALLPVVTLPVCGKCQPIHFHRYELEHTSSESGYVCVSQQKDDKAGCEQKQKSRFLQQDQY